MKLSRTLPPLLLLVLLFTGCRNTGIIAPPNPDELQVRDYDSVEGLWVSTDETSWHSESDTQRVVLHIQQNARGAVQVEGYFARNGDYHMKWELLDVQYDEQIRRITILDADEDTLIGFVDDKYGMIDGAVHLRDGPVNPLNFVRSNDNKLAVRLLYPRLPDGDGNITYTYRPPDQLDDGLATSALPTGDAKGAISKVVERIINQEFGHIKSLLVMQNSQLVVEEYFFGYDREQLQRINSCTKSVASLLLGIALGNHPDINVDRAVFSLFPEYDSLKTPAYAAVSLEHLLTMTSGIAWDENDRLMEEADDWLGYLLSRPLQYEAGTTFNYDNGCSNLLCGVIYKLEGPSVSQYANNTLFRPLGITQYTWVTNDNGMLDCGAGLAMRPRDMAKIGLLVLNNGVWQGRQLVPAEWIRESTQAHVVESEYFDYGYQWWYRSKNKKPWWKKGDQQASNEPDLFTAMGAGGQFITIIRDLNLVVVTTASDYNENDVWLSKIPLIVEELIPALSSFRDG